MKRSVTAREAEERRSRRPWRTAARILAVVLVVGVAWSAWSVWQVQRDLASARAAAGELPGTLAEGRESSSATLDDLQRHAGAARERTSGATWAVLSRLPVLGDDFEAVARASSAVDVLAREGAGPLVDSGVSAATFAPRGDRLPVSEIAGLVQPLAAAKAGFERARAELEPIEVQGLAREVRGGVETLVDEVDDGIRTLDGAERAAAVLPTMLGAEGPRTYLLVFQNNAEPRSLGGMPGLMAPLRVRDGRLSLGDVVAAGSFPELDRPVLPLTEDERAIWREQPGTWFQDAVFIPDFPRASELMAARFRLETGTDVDGVLSVDPVALSYLLDATGPIRVEGRRLTSDNFVDEVLHEPYVRYQDDPAAEDAFFSAIMASVFDRLLSPRTDPAALIDALSRAAGEGRLLVHSFDAAEQRRLAGARVAGEFASDPDGPAQAAVYVNDATASKMGYYLDYDTRVSSVSCADGVIGFNGSLRIHSSAPADAADLPPTITGPGTYGVARGDHLNVFDLVAPTGGRITDVVVNGVRSRGTNRGYMGRPAVSVPILLTPGDVVTVTWRATSGPGHSGGVELVSTPGVHHGGEKQYVSAPCAAGGTDG